MSWNMIIFGFGFIVGGFTVMLTLGIVSLIKHKTAIHAHKKVDREPMQDVRHPRVYPPLTVFIGGKEQIF